MTLTNNSSFLANISHEMRTPLNVILGFSRLLDDPTLTIMEQREYTKLIEKNSEQLLKLVDEILDLTKMESGNMTIEKIEFSLVGLLHDFMSSMRTIADEKNIRLVLNIHTPLPKFVISDPSRIRQILNNMVGNALKFTERGQVEVHVAVEGQQLEFQVWDTGCGISEDQQPLLFQPFKQANNSISRKFGGSGLGLVLTRNICEALQGEFFLKESRLGSGSRFTARLKLEVPNPEDVAEIPEAIETVYPPLGELRHQLSGVRVLLAEDCPDNQMLFSIYLKRQGALVALARDGEEAMDIALAKDFDVVLMDIQMPKVDGMTAVRKLRSYYYSKPIIALTAHSMKEDREKCIQIGFTDFLSKPVKEAELVQKIQYHLKLEARAAFLN